MISVARHLRSNAMCGLRRRITNSAGSLRGWETVSRPATSRHLDKQNPKTFFLISAVTGAWRHDAVASRVYPDVRQPQHFLPCQGLEC